MQARHPALQADAFSALPPNHRIPALDRGQFTLSTRVPVHSLGISQILSYGLMFYAFAALKTPVAAATSLGESTVLTVLSMALILQAILMPIVGSWCDRHGALSVMRIGFLTGAAGIAGLGFAGAVPFPQ